MERYKQKNSKETKQIVAIQSKTVETKFTNIGNGIYKNQKMKQRKKRPALGIFCIT